ncbi:3212_t:CDS:1, partial [Rhizophagus irregularis]
QLIQLDNSIQTAPFFDFLGKNFDECSVKPHLSNRNMTEQLIQLDNSIQTAPFFDFLGKRF